MRMSASATIKLTQRIYVCTEADCFRGVRRFPPSHGTPREAIRFSAKLRLPRSTTYQHLESIPEGMLTELGLLGYADTHIGEALVKGVSGKRKRSSVAVELAVKPAVLFLDEPTSGFDIYCAVQLCQVLKKIADAGASVLFAIHQPSWEIFNSFDYLILLNKGRVIYIGTPEGAPEFFAVWGLRKNSYKL
jgi:ABC-type multidrug transport system ATPase subunit